MRDPSAIASFPAAEEFCAFWRKSLAGLQDAQELPAAVRRFTATEASAFVHAHRAHTAPLAGAWSDALLRLAYGEGHLFFSLDLLALPPLFAALGWSVPDAERWRSACPPPPDADADPARAVAVHLARLMARAMADSPAGAMRVLIADIPLQHRDTLAAAGRALAAAGWFDSDPAAVLAVAQRRLDAVETRDGCAAEPVHALLGLLGFHKHAPRDWLERVYRDVALPALRRALAADDADLALELEYTNYQVYLRQTENRDHVRRFFSEWTPQMVESGRRLRGMPPAPQPADPSSPPVIAFFLPFASWLAHVRTFANLLEALNSLDTPPFRARVYLFEGKHHELPARLRALGAEVEIIPPRPQQRRDWRWRIMQLRERLARAGIDTLVFVSSPIFMPFATAVRTAPVQVWWSLKYHGLELPDLDGYVTGGSVGERTRIIEGREWRIAPSSLADLGGAELEQEARRIRRELAAPGPVLGSLVRPEKLLSDPFLDALGEILRANPRALFLWFGRRRDAAVERAFDARGIGGQCRYCGWVNTRVYARVLDIHLDTFPFPAGVTMIETTAAGVPGVNYLSDESRSNGIIPVILPVLNGEDGAHADQTAVRGLLTTEDGGPLFFCARSPAEYVTHAQRLIDDAALRHAAGEGARLAFAHLNRPGLTAAQFAAHLRDIAAQRRHATRGN